MTSRAGGAIAGLMGFLLITTAVQGASSGAWQPAGKMMVGRASPQAILLADGTVLITGGVGQTGDNFAPLITAERFDPKTDQFTAVSAMSEPRDDSHRAVRLADGRVLVTGGSPDFSAHSQSAELFDPATGAFAVTGNLTLGRAAHTASLLPDGQVLIVGGYSDGGPAASAELFDPSKGQFAKTGSLSQARYRHAAVALPDGRILVMGGYGHSDQALSSVEIYDPATGAFSARGQLAEARGDLTAALAPDGRIIVAGGFYTDANGDNIGARRSVELYDPATGQSTITDGLSDERANFAAVLLRDGRLLAAGGRDDLGPDQGSILKTADLIDPVTGKVSPAESMSVGRDGAGGVLLPDGRVLALGGLSWQGKLVILDSAELFVP